MLSCRRRLSTNCALRTSSLRSLLQSHRHLADWHTENFHSATGNWPIILTIEL